MLRPDNFSKFTKLRKEFPFFSYDRYQYHYNGSILEFSFQFNLSDRYFFQPQIKIPYKSEFFQPYVNLSGPVLDNLVFHIGLIELISYWKAACPPLVIIKPHHINARQIEFWKKLYYYGLGEFFYLNSIETDKDDFMDMKSEGIMPLISFRESARGKSLVPVGGGKDSAVSMGLLNEAGADWLPFALNPRKAIREVIKAAGKDESQTVEFHREIHPQLLKLNEEGFLNGHTPFSALLAFHTLLAAHLTGCSEIILSNESSANEVTVPGTSINHQYSKSYTFERDFREYVNSYISEDFNYFSLLRPYSEVQIGAVFSKMPGFFKSFKSCNAGSKNDSWCGACPKCLFSFIILSPFLEPDQMTGIFGKNLLDDPSLVNILDELTGRSEIKPFECVGTVDEINASLDTVMTKYKDGKLPCLLEYHRSERARQKVEIIQVDQLMDRFDPEHFVPEKYFNMLMKALR